LLFICTLFSGLSVLSYANGRAEHLCYQTTFKSALEMDVDEGLVQEIDDELAEVEGALVGFGHELG
jgi:hypothetical protein